MSQSRSTPASVPAQFANAAPLADAYARGWAHAHGIACYNVPTLGTKYWTDTEGHITAKAENIRELHYILCFEAADNSRPFSPFECIAPAADLWEAFEAGVNDAISADIASYTDDDYGIEPAEETAEEPDGIVGPGDL